MNDVVGKYATELADIECPECGAENRINTEGIELPEWSCKECGYTPDWQLMKREADGYPCTWCGKDISDDHRTVTKCRNCSKEARKREKMRQNQCCPHWGEMLSADDLRKIKKARSEARKKYENKEGENSK